MTDNPAEQLRQSRSISIAAVLDLSQSGAASDSLATMSNPVAIPVRVEYQGGSDQSYGQMPGNPAAGGAPSPMDGADRGQMTGPRSGPRTGPRVDTGRPVAEPASPLVPPARRRRVNRPEF